MRKIFASKLLKAPAPAQKPRVAGVTVMKIFRPPESRRIRHLRYLNEIPACGNPGSSPGKWRVIKTYVICG